MQRTLAERLISLNNGRMPKDGKELAWALIPARTAAFWTPATGEELKQVLIDLGLSPTSVPLMELPEHTLFLAAYNEGRTQIFVPQRLLSRADLLVYDTLVRRGLEFKEPWDYPDTQNRLSQEVARHCVALRLT